MQKVTLREATIEDAQFIYEMMQDEEYQKFFPSNLIATNIEDQKRKLRHFEAQAKNGAGNYFVILYNKERAGIIDLYKIDKKNNRAGIGYGVAKQFRKKGIATNAIKKAQSFAKTKLKLHALSACIHPKNKASQKALEKNGFKQIGRAEDYDFEKGKYEDRLLYWKIL